MTLTRQQISELKDAFHQSGQIWYERYIDAVADQNETPITKARKMLCRNMIEESHPAYPLYHTADEGLDITFYKTMSNGEHGISIEITNGKDNYRIACDTMEDFFSMDSNYIEEVLEGDYTR